MPNISARLTFGLVSILPNHTLYHKVFKQLSIMSPSAVPVEESVMDPDGLSTKPKAASAIRPSYEIREEPIHSRRSLRIACLGAGYSGMLMGIIFNQRMQDRNIELVVYERNESLGGTWLENR
jgi:hypothetical protein